MSTELIVQGAKLIKNAVVAVALLAAEVAGWIADALQWLLG